MGATQSTDGIVLPAAIAALVPFLAGLYNTEASTRTFINTCSLDESKTAFHPDMHSTWGGIVRRAYTNGTLGRILQEAEKPEELGANPDFLQAVARTREVGLVARLAPQPPAPSLPQGGSSLPLSTRILGAVAIAALMAFVVHELRNDLRSPTDSGPRPSAMGATSVTPTGATSVAPPGSDVGSASGAPTPSGVLPSTTQGTSQQAASGAHASTGGPTVGAAAGSATSAPASCKEIPAAQSNGLLWQLECRCDGTVTKRSQPFPVPGADTSARAAALISAVEHAKQEQKWSCP